MPIAPLVVLGTVVFTVVNALKFLTAKAWNSLVTQVIAWVAGVVGIFAAGATQFADGIGVGGVSLAHLNTPSKVFLGLGATSLLSTVNEIKKALDASDTAVTPSLLPAKAQAPPAPEA